MPKNFIENWFKKKSWKLHDHQIKMIESGALGLSTLLIAPTGGGKTLAGFLPSIIELNADPTNSLHTIYISPLKALTVDVARNLLEPLSEMDLKITVETRTGDTPQSKRQRQRKSPPNILLTTPESLALLISYPDSSTIFQELKCIVIDELHALATTKRGDLLSLALARLNTWAPKARRVGLSATIPYPEEMAEYLSCDQTINPVQIIEAKPTKKPSVEILIGNSRLPWSGHMGIYAADEIYSAILNHETSLIFVNTRAQAELVFQALWKVNDKNLAIALHHGSLSVEQRRIVENAMVKGALRAVVATSSLDLGIDWAAVDLVIQIGAPKGVSRLLQRIGRSNHRLDEPSKAILVPANRFEVLECQAAFKSILDENLDGDILRQGGLDVLAQHIQGVACSGPFDKHVLFNEIRNASAYKHLSLEDFNSVISFVCDGGYALKTYDRYRRIKLDDNDLYRIVDSSTERRYRMNVGTIVESTTLKVKMRRGRFLGEVEEYFAQGLVPGDTFIFAGRLLTFEGIRETTIEVSPGRGETPKVPSYIGGRLPLSSNLAEGVRALLQNPSSWRNLAAPVKEWLERQEQLSTLPKSDELLVEIFQRRRLFYMVAYSFEGRNAHQTLGMLLTRRMERSGTQPLGFVATDYAIAIWSLKQPSNIKDLFDEDMLGDDLENWMAESTVLKRTFRDVAVIAGLIDRRLPGHKKTGKQVTFSSDLIYDVLRKYDPNHILLRATRADAARGFTDIHRLGALLKRIKTNINVKYLTKVSPLAVPILLEIGRENVKGSAIDSLLDDAEEALISEGMAMQ